MPKFTPILIGLITLASVVCARADPITTGSLLHDLTDLRQMAEFPSPAYVTRQASSYDRASVAPDRSGWFANDDAGQYVRDERHGERVEHVLMDERGPGAIVRLWSANPGGTLRIYLDDNPEPVIAAAMADVLGGRCPGLPAPIAAEHARGFTSYLPIPYRVSCKVTAETEKLYYHVDYRTYPAGTDVRTFTPADLTDNAAAIGATAAALASPQTATPDARTTTPFAVQLAPGASTDVLRTEDGGAVSNFTVKVDPDTPDLEASVRGVVVRMTFDGETTVEAPLGDFFGAGPGINPYAGLPLGVDADGEMYCHWVMPFRTSAAITLVNEGHAAVRLGGRTALAAFAWGERSMHFHCDYRAQYDVSTAPKSDRTYLSASGRGVFAGIALAVDNPLRQWWGEGDEKIYVDQEKFPGWFGTGSEDYFSYAWCSPERYSHAFHSQARCDGPDNYGRTSVNRFHIVDRIPFQNAFRFDMELWHWRQCAVDLAATTYWYAVPGGTSRATPLTPADLVVRPMPAYQVPKVSGVIEAETLPVLERTAHVTAQDWPEASGGRQLWWHDRPRVGERLVLGFDAPAAGHYRVAVRLLKARDYGIFRLAVNDVAASGPVNLYDPEPVYADEQTLGVVDLKQGTNRLSVTVVGSDPRAEPQLMFGLDYLRLTPTSDSATLPPSTTPAADAWPSATAAPPLVSARAFRRVYDSSTGERQPWYVNDHCFVHDATGHWHLFGITHAEPAAPLDETEFAHATTSALRASQWQKQPAVLRADLPDWNETVLWAPFVLNDNGLYHMFYCAGDPDLTRYKLHLATSPDLLHWTRSPNNPLVVDGYQARDPMVLRDGDRWVMYYTANTTPQGGRHVVKAVVSQDLVHWTGPRVVFTAPFGGTIAGPCESPFVVRRGGFYYLFTGPWDDYVGTRVFRSRDPMQWRPSDEVARIDAHAAEVVRDTDGRWYVSHAGWGQGGVYLAPLDWNDGQDNADTSMPVPTAVASTQPRGVTR